MTIDQIKVLAAGGESHQLEFKKSMGLISAAFKSITAFLNSDGGTVLIGVTDKGDIIGADATDKNQQTISNEISKIEPYAIVQVTYSPLEGADKHIIILHVQPGLYKPYVYEGRPFYREQTVTKRMSQQFYDQLVAQRKQLNFSWETQIASEYTPDDLDHDLVLGVVRKAVETRRMPEEALRQEIPDLLEALKLTTEDHQLKNAAVALFGKEMTANFLQCEIKLARFKGLDRTEFLDSERAYGNVFELLEMGMMFVKRHLPVAAKIAPGKLERVETPLIPFDAIRETLINALCHRDYSGYGGAIGLAIYDDRMEIFNSGRLPSGITLQKIKSGYSDPHNPLIAGVFYRADLIESWGRGIPGIIRSCLAANDPEPEFFADALEFKVVFPFPTSLKPPVFGEGPETEDLALRQQDILNILSDGKAYTAKEIKDKIQSPITDRTLRRDLMALKTLGLIDLRGRAKTSTWFLLRTL